MAVEQWACARRDKSILHGNWQADPVPAKLAPVRGRRCDMWSVAMIILSTSPDPDG
jgi:hypothetical protein